MELETPSPENKGKSPPENPAIEARDRIADRAERVFDVPEADGMPQAEPPLPEPEPQSRSDGTAEEKENALDLAMERPLRGLGSRISKFPGIRNLSEDTMNRIGTAGILGTLASAPLLNMGSNVWLFHNVVKPLSSWGYFSFSTSSELVGWTLFGSCMAISATNFLISRGRVFNVGEFSKICLSNDPQIAELHVQRNLKTVKGLSETERLAKFFEDVANALAELESARSEKFSEIREVRMHSWILSKNRIRKAFVESLRDRGFETEDRGVAKGAVGFGKKFALSALLALSGEGGKSAKRLLSRDSEEGLVVVKMGRGT